VLRCDHPLRCGPCQQLTALLGTEPLSTFSLPRVWDLGGACHCSVVCRSPGVPRVACVNRPLNLRALSRGCCRLCGPLEGGALSCGGWACGLLWARGLVACAAW
jgi:hypothetical protein